MRTKLQLGHFLRLSRDGWPSSAAFTPHLNYANLDFDNKTSRVSQRRLLKWLALVGPLDWSEERTLRYLRLHQQDFRKCLDWLTRGGIAALSDVREDYRGFDDYDFDFNVREFLVGVPEVQFLKRHALDHAEIELGHDGLDRSPFAGLALEQGSLKDPLDPICWCLLALLVRDSQIHIRRCRYSKCHKYFSTENAGKKIYCHDICRIKDHTKSAEEMRIYMRKHRKDKKAEAQRIARARARSKNPV